MDVVFDDDVVTFDSQTYTFDGNIVTVTVPITLPVSMQKKFVYKIYSSTGQYITTWNDVVNDPQFETVINGGFVELVVSLGRNTQNFGEGVDVAFNNELRLYCFDNDMPNGVRIFCGFISRYEPINNGYEDTIQVHFLGYHQKLQNYVYENARGETLLNINNVDPALIAQSILDNAAALSGSPVIYTLNTSLQLVLVYQLDYLIYRFNLIEYHSFLFHPILYQIDFVP